MKKYKVKKKNVISKKIFLYYFLIAISSSFVFNNNKKEVRVEPTAYIMDYYNNDITLDDIKRLIYSSPYLTDEEKEFLYKENYFEALIPLINEDDKLKSDFIKKMSNINIEYFNREEHPHLLGYYKGKERNTIHLSNEIEDKVLFDDILAHEFIHLTNFGLFFNVISESTAEIMSYEFYDQSANSAYKEQVRLVKKLMEIIGTEPIFNYSVTGNLDYIFNEVGSYLDLDDYKEFIDCLFFKIGDPPEKSERFNELLNLLYERKFNSDIKDNIVIRNIDENYEEMNKRFYFNEDYKNKYSLVRNVVSLEDAINKGDIGLYYYNDNKTNQITSYKEYIELKDKYDIYIGYYVGKKILDDYSILSNDYIEVESPSKNK